MMAVHIVIDRHGLEMIRTVTFHETSCTYNHHVDDEPTLIERRDALGDMMDRWHNMGCKACRARIVE